MSNQQVGTVFDRVIQEVCDASEVDFEESGVDQQTLLDLRKSWQKKLSSLGVAHFPWDPAPQPAAAQTPNPILPPTVPSNAPRPAPSPQIQQPQRHVPPQQLPQSMPGGIPPMQAAPYPLGQQQQPPRIKTEAGVGVSGPPGYPNMGGTPMMPGVPPNPQSARDRAASMLQQRYGAAAANSVNQLQSQSQGSLAMPGQPRPPHLQHVNGQMQMPKSEPGYRPSIGHTQTDGPGDDDDDDDDGTDAYTKWKAEVARRREAAAQQNGEGDRLLRDQLQQRMLQMEGNGLMLPLSEHTRRPAGRPAAGPLGTTITSTPGQFDGVDDEEDERVENDEDAINSDLDDPDDLVADEHDGDDAVGQVMLCTYDKVQRVKNKWKCTLKDGILTTGGKEYVFHKGQGEFEW
ncbi:hypothetical protein ASPZODRAFT_152651 [Penicilliopsis zonata CBS 506.65]|uniref:Transcription initiation factor IIA large subunit n=1 Tax=Penicilliopsis zonata CBS 506.65 TaxID=1073090 RepID=A0A1L9SEN4_9EURO|nr:hypothetical protein ASPZODRAFT_152651 [Penicilliopsis zonata CBS 506.65]OJJ45612.1 hypothetical protein ASPZODRAFT_152651 [Penicilliopsis zonata CBS 506.65]